MNPEELFCLNPECHAKGHVGKGNIRIHSNEEGRCQCTECGDTFSATKGTIFYRLRTPAATVVLMLTLLAHGCPVLSSSATRHYKTGPSGGLDCTCPSNELPIKKTRHQAGLLITRV